MNFLEQLHQQFTIGVSDKALCINDVFYTYGDLAARINSIRHTLSLKLKGEKKIIGIYTENNIETYASIVACWFSGCAFVPLNAQNPTDRNRDILSQIDATLILGSSDSLPVFEYEFICTTLLMGIDGPLPLTEVGQEDLLCILFTSGSTGKPKGVPMNKRNMDSTLDAFFALEYNLSSKDGVLQMFDFSFDMSLLAYIPAFMAGACVYTVGEDKIRYLAALKVMQKYPVTFASMVPSTLAFLRPYFSRIRLECLRYSIVGGEPFYNDLATEWAQCIPNATVINISGPTEITMACMGYKVNPDPSKNKHRNGILAFGKPWKNTTAIVVDSDLHVLPDSTIGELSFAGEHVMDGYWKMESKNKEVFFIIENTRFYRTGDMTLRDEEGDFYSCGRIDHQVKIQGHKVELGEIEFHSHKLLSTSKVAAITVSRPNGMIEIILFTEANAFDDNTILEYLRSKVPPYMLPSEIRRIKEFPLNKNGKTDRLALSKMI